MDLRRELEVVTAAVREAGALAMQHFGGPLQVDEKPGDQGPVSNADRACDALLRQRLGQAFPDDALLTEESEDDGRWRTAHRVWMIDPIDGTREYVEGVAQFAIMVGLCVDGVPTLGSVLLPPQNLLLTGVVGQGAKANQDAQTTVLKVPRQRQAGSWQVAVSRSHPSPKVDRVLAALGEVDQHPMGSVGVKISAVAHGQADLYLAATGKIKLWDTCGPHAILSAAGGYLVDFNGDSLDYREQLAHPRGLLACPADSLETLLAITRPMVAELFGPAAPA